MLDFTVVGGCVFEVWGACSWVLNQDLQDLQDFRGRLCIESKGNLKIIVFDCPFLSSYIT